MGCDCGERQLLIRKWIESECTIINNTAFIFSADIPYIGLYRFVPGHHVFKNALLGAKIVRYFNKITPDAFSLEAYIDGNKILNDAPRFD